MVLRWTPTKHDVRLAARTARLSGPFLIRHATQLVMGLILVVLVVLQLAGVHVWPSMGLPAASLVLGGSLRDRSTWLRPAVRQPAEAALTEDEIRLNRRHTHPWSAVRYAVETAEQFVLVSAKEPTRFVAYLPKRAMAEPAAVRDFLAARGEVRSA